MSSSSKRREIDVMKLMMNDYVVEPIEDANNEFHVEFHGPKESLYEGRVWNVYVKLPKTYPYKPPIIRFVDKILHPNIDECGSICLNAINESWSPMFDLMNVFEVFLPQLLLYPNPSHPLNMDAALLLHRDQEQYEQRVKEYCERYAKAEKKTGAQAEEGDDDDSDCQSVPSDVDDDDETHED